MTYLSILCLDKWLSRILNLCLILPLQQTRVKANFGNRPFAYAEGRQHRNAADECHDQAKEIREAFGALPFHLGSDSDSEGATTVSSGSADSGREVRTPPGPACKVASVPKSLRGEFDRKCEMCPYIKLVILNSLSAKLFRGDINIYLHFMSFLHTNNTQVVEIPPIVRQGNAYST